MKSAYIMRGIPGSGKSTVAKLLASTSRSSAIHSTDDYHVVNGKYKFDRGMLWVYHQRNLDAFTESCRKGVKVVVCDNTNFKKEFYSKYVKAAKRHGYKVFVVTVGDFNVRGCWKRNRHKVPLRVVKGMKEAFEL